MSYDQQDHFQFFRPEGDMSDFKLSAHTFNNRILICDDNEDIHKDFYKILNVGTKSPKDVEIENFEDALFSDDPEFEVMPKQEVSFEIDSAYQGKDALEMAEKAYEAGKPYAVVFMDVRMPPGWDGILTVERIWRKLPFTEVVIVTAYSDYSWDDMINKLGVNDKLLFIKKPFDSLTVKQLALNLTTKWNVAYQARRHISELEREVRARVEALDKTIRGM